MHPFASSLEPQVHPLSSPTFEMREEILTRPCVRPAYEEEGLKLRVEGSRGLSMQGQCQKADPSALLVSPSLLECLLKKKLNKTLCPSSCMLIPPTHAKNSKIDCSETTEVYVRSPCKLGDNYPWVGDRLVRFLRMLVRP